MKILAAKESQNPDFNTKTSHLPIFSKLFIASLFSCSILLLRIIVTRDFMYAFLVWNLFLAWIPFLLSILSVYVADKIKFNRWLLLFIPILVMWLLFLPNSTYIMTDFIHAIRHPINAYPNLIIRQSSLAWVDIIMLMSFSLTGHFCGIESMIIIRQRFLVTAGKRLVRFLAIVISLLCGFGIYLGRFIRLNSWDAVIHPVKTVSIIIQSLSSVRCLGITVMLGALIFITWLVVSPESRGYIFPGRKSVLQGKPTKNG